MGLIIAIVALSVIAIGEGLLIWALINRILMQAKLPAIQPLAQTPPAPEPVQEPRRKLFSVDIPI